MVETNLTQALQQTQGKLRSVLVINIVLLQTAENVVIKKLTFQKLPKNNLFNIDKLLSGSLAAQSF
jgi:TRAP-type mannitol/chloroaromatic compound transport system permease small subunit